MGIWIKWMLILGDDVVSRHHLRFEIRDELFLKPLCYRRSVTKSIIQRITNPKQAF